MCWDKTTRRISAGDTQHALSCAFHYCAASTSNMLNNMSKSLIINFYSSSP